MSYMRNVSVVSTSHLTGIKEYISPKLTCGSLDTFFLRRSILSAVEKVSVEFSGIVLDIGCGHMPYRDLILSGGNVLSYVGMDLQHNDNYQNCPDLLWDGLAIPLPDHSVDCAMATEVLEHCPEPDVVISEIFRVLKPGGIFFFTIPFLWPLHDLPHDQYRYTPFAIARHLEKAEFHRLQLRSMGGWERSLGQMLGLYLRRRPMPVVLRCFLSLLALPIVYVLGRVKEPQYYSGEESGWQEHFFKVPMMIGLSGIAYKPNNNHI